MNKGHSQAITEAALPCLAPHNALEDQGLIRFNEEAKKISGRRRRTCRGLALVLACAFLGPAPTMPGSTYETGSGASSPTAAYISRPSQKSLSSEDQGTHQDRRDSKMYPEEASLAG
jgi:hypothetical protein